MNLFHRLTVILLFTTITYATSDDTKLTVGFNLMSMDYMEYSQSGEKLDSEKSDALPGFTLGYQTRLLDGIDQDGGFIDLSFSHYQGTTTYTGSDLNNPNGKFGDLVLQTTNKLNDGTLSYIQNMSAINLLFSLQGGLGYRQWDRILADGHEEAYKWFYGFIKAGATKNIFKHDNLGVSIQYHRALSPTMSSNLYGTFDLGDTQGYAISVPWTHQLNRLWDFQLNYTYKTWDISLSNVVSGMYEPRSESSFHTLGLAFIYKYNNGDE